MKKIILLFLLCFSAITVNAEKIDETQIMFSQQIGNLYGIQTHSGEKYVTDGEYNILGGPYELVADNSGYCSVTDSDGSKILFDLDGSIIATAPENYDINTPYHGIYTIREREEDDTAELIIYDYETNKELLRTTGGFLYYLEQQSDKMFIKSNGKYAIIDNKCNFITDYIYDDVKKRFNPDYEPFPKAYAIVVQDGEEKYIDRDLNEINLDDYNGEPFITNCRHMNEEYYELENGTKYALYDMAEDKIIIPYQSEYKFMAINDKYIIVERGDESAVLDYSGNVVVPYSNSRLSFTDDGLVSYYHYDGDTAHEGVLNPEDGRTAETPLEAMGYFYKVLGETDKDNIAFGTIISENKAADIREEDLKKFLDVYWNFNYERVIAPIDPDRPNDTYIKLWNKDKTKAYIIYQDSGVITGAFGQTSESHGQIKTNYVWYLPVVGNGRNALYTAFENIRHTYFDENYEGYVEAKRDITEADRIEIPADNVLPIAGCSDWAEPEIQKAAACNLLIYELTDKYTENITRLDFCKLAYRMIITEFSPLADSRMDLWHVASAIKEEKNLTEKYNSVSFSDCERDEVAFLTAADIIKGMGDGTFAPDENITREQAAAILYRMAEFLGNKTLIKPEYDKIYDDENDISDWALTSVASMKAMGIMKGVSETEFAPKEAYTIEQAIATMLRLYECN